MDILIRKLEGFAPLSAGDRALIADVIGDARTIDAQTVLVREGDKSDYVQLILEGFACRCKITSEGNRQIMAYLVPGDFCDLHVFVLDQMDHTIATLSPCKVVRIPRDKILEWLRSPTLSVALWYAALVDAAVLREWLVNIGQRSAKARVAHLLCELLLRLRAVGLANGGGYELPITQTELADTMGLSTVHVNRVLQSLRKADLITWKGENLVVLDTDRLMELSGFQANYLHILRHPRMNGAC